MYEEPSSAIREVVTRGQEEKWAAKNHRLTKILGWCMITSFFLLLISGIFTDKLELDIILIIGGCAILQGSQAWLRFYIFLASVLCISEILGIALPLFRGEPIELNNRWLDFHDRRFWLEAVLPVGVQLAFTTLCIVTLRSRQLVFWTRTCKRWIGGLVICVAVIGLTVVAVPIFKKEVNEPDLKRAETSLQAAEKYAYDHGANISSPDFHTLQELVETDASIERLCLFHGPGSVTMIYNRRVESVGSNDDWDYEKFIRARSGRWVMVKAKLTK